MGWVKRKVDEHVCQKPSHDYSMSNGDIWQCDGCHIQWRIVDIEFEDRPCGSVFVHWTRHYDNSGNTGYWRD